MRYRRRDRIYPVLFAAKEGLSFGVDYEAIFILSLWFGAGAGPRDLNLEPSLGVCIKASLKM